MEFNALRKIPGFGIILAGLSGAAFASGTLFVKLLPDYNPIQVLVGRSLGSGIVFAVLVLAQCEDLRGYPGERLMIFLRSLFGIGLTFCSYSSFQLLPLGDASAIIFSSPAFASIVACILLKEPCVLFESIVIPCGIIGTVLISRPSFLFPDDHDGNRAEDDPFKETRLEGSLLALCASLSASFMYVTMRKLQKTSSSVIIFWFCWIVVVVGCVYVHFVDQLKPPANWWDGLYFLCCAVCGILGQLFLTIALKLEDAGPVSMARTMDVVVAFIYQSILLHEPVLWSSILGTVIVCSCVITVYLNKWKRKKYQEAILSRKSTETREEECSDSEEKTDSTSSKSV